MRSGEIGGVQNTATNVGASLGTALAGSIMITILAASVVTGIQQKHAVSDEVRSLASVELASGVPFLSDTRLRQGLADTQTPPDIATEVIHLNAQARVDGLNAALALLAVIAVASLLFTAGIPTQPPGGSTHEPSQDSGTPSRP